MSEDLRPARPGEEIDAARLAAWLNPRLGLEGEPSIAQFPSGHSNLTYLVKWPGGREVVLRRPPAGTTVKTAHDVGREHRILARLPDVYPPAPRALALCEDAAVIGAPFFVMERVEGVVLRGARPPKGLAWSAETMRAISEAAVDGLAALHAVDAAAAGLGDLGRPEGYVARQVRGWSERYRAARTDDVPSLEDVMAWLAERAPAERGAALIHGDWKLDNLVLEAAGFAPGADPASARIAAVLDWEMATIGCPLMDLGTTLGYWIDADDPPDVRALALGPTTLEGCLPRRAVVERYAARSGRAIAGGEAAYFYVYGLFKVAGIAQQIYARWRKGLTKDERFARMGAAVAALGAQAARAIARGRVDGLA
jgi:aminoglycoside phosphotransferase (APT) family kinase protein